MTGHRPWREVRAELEARREAAGRPARPADPPPTPTDVDALVTHLDALLVRAQRAGYRPPVPVVDAAYDALVRLRDLLEGPPPPPTGVEPGSSAEVYP